MTLSKIGNLYWAVYSELSAIRHGRPMSDHYEVDQLLGRLERAAKAQDAAPQGDFRAGVAACVDAAKNVLPAINFGNGEYMRREIITALESITDSAASPAAQEQEVNSGEGLSDKELRMMEEWAGAKIADDNSDQDLYDMVVKTDHYLSAAVKEIRRLRTRARISVADDLEREVNSGEEVL